MTTTTTDPISEAWAVIDGPYRPKRLHVPALREHRFRNRPADRRYYRAPQGEEYALPPCKKCLLMLRNS